MVIGKKLLIKLLLATRVFEKKGIPVLLYHRITNNSDDKRLAFTTFEQFKQQMFYLKQKGYYSITTSELEESFLGYRSISGKEVIITFDDGFKDNYSAIKLANSMGFITTVFVATDFIGKSMEHIPFKGNEDLKIQELRTAIPNLIRFLNVEEIQELSKAGNEFFPHTGSHVCLSKEKESVQQNQIIQSREILRKITGKNCNSFSYPYGVDTEYSLSVLKCNGFTSAYAVSPGTNKKGDDRYEIKRHGVCDVDNLAFFSLLLSDRYKIYRKISNFLKRRAR